MTALKYAGWKTYTTKNFQVEFKYPTAWSLDDQTEQQPDPTTTDLVTLTAPDGFIMNIDPGDFGAPSIEYQAILFNQPTTIAGAPVYVDFLHELEKTPVGEVNGFFVSTSPTAANKALDHRNFALAVLGMTKTPESIAAAKANPDYAKAMQLVSSISFSK